MRDKTPSGTSNLPTDSTSSITNLSASTSKLPASCPPIQYRETVSGTNSQASIDVVEQDQAGTSSSHEARPDSARSPSGTVSFPLSSSSSSTSSSTTTNTSRPNANSMLQTTRLPSISAITDLLHSSSTAHSSSTVPFGRDPRSGLLSGSSDLDTRISERFHRSSSSSPKSISEQLAMRSSSFGGDHLSRLDPSPSAATQIASRDFPFSRGPESEPFRRGVSRSIPSNSREDRILPFFNADASSRGEDRAAGGSSYSSTTSPSLSIGNFAHSAGEYRPHGFERDSRIDRDLEGTRSFMGLPAPLPRRQSGQGSDSSSSSSVSMHESVGDEQEIHPRSRFASGGSKSRSPAAGPNFDLESRTFENQDEGTEDWKSEVMGRRRRVQVSREL